VTDVGRLGKKESGRKKLEIVFVTQSEAREILIRKEMRRWM
jgi:hypothetical protein